MIDPTDEQLAGWRLQFEDSLIERKTAGDSKDWVKTVVAFANSAPRDRCAVLYIGVRDDGAIEDRSNVGWDDLQKTLRRRLDAVYPPITYSARVMNEQGREYLCVVVTGSELAPHFAGPAYVRLGSETVIASAQQHERLIAQRNSKAYRILQHQGKLAQLQEVRTGRSAELLGRIVGQAAVTIIDCDQFCVAVRNQYGAVQTIGLDRVDLLRDPAWSTILVLEVRSS